MSEYLFGTGRGKIADRDYKRIIKIARKHGVVFVNPKLPGEGYRFWFAGPNRGHPFDRALCESVMADLEKAGIKLWS